jgi:hypothetical protein
MLGNSWGIHQQVQNYNLLANKNIYFRCLMALCNEKIMFNNFLLFKVKRVQIAMDATIGSCGCCCTFSTHYFFDA